MEHLAHSMVMHASFNNARTERNAVMSPESSSNVAERDDNDVITGNYIPERKQCGLTCKVESMRHRRPKPSSAKSMSEAAAAPGCDSKEMIRWSELWTGHKAHQPACVATMKKSLMMTAIGDCNDVVQGDHILELKQCGSTRKVESMHHRRPKQSSAKSMLEAAAAPGCDSKEMIRQSELLTGRKARQPARVATTKKSLMMTTIGDCNDVVQGDHILELKQCGSTRKVESMRHRRPKQSSAKSMSEAAAAPGCDSKEMIRQSELLTGRKARQPARVATTKKSLMMTAIGDCNDIVQGDHIPERKQCGSTRKVESMPHRRPKPSSAKSMSDAALGCDSKEMIRWSELLTGHKARQPARVATTKKSLMMTAIGDGSDLIPGDHIRHHEQREPTRKVESMHAGRPKPSSAHNIPETAPAAEAGCNTKELLRALELYTRHEELQTRMATSNKSLLMAAIGGVVMLGGAAATAATVPLISALGTVVVVGGVFAEFMGLVTFVKTA